LINQKTEAMKKILLCSTGLLFFIAGVKAQSKVHRLGIYAGGGSQKYSGDLGNGFTFNNTCWYGNVAAQASYRLNRSFDAGAFFSVGDYGYCQTREEASRIIADAERCPGCMGRTGLGNLNSRLTAFGFNTRYQLANGYILPESFKLRPYLHGGIAYNVVRDRMKMNCVNEGEYLSLNFGAGARIYLNDRISFGYQLTFGYLDRDNVDRHAMGGNDMYMQNSLFMGIDIF
jgi:hypothetical protein